MLFQKRENHNTAFYIMLGGVCVMLIVAIFCAICFMHMMKEAEAKGQEPYQSFGSHCVLITDNTEEAFWDEVYRGAQEEGYRQNVYVERLGENLPVDYSTRDLLRVAINSSVDGIILCGEKDEETTALINEAVEKGIFVVTIRQDVEESDRQCFVGINHYDLGQEYGRQILQVMNMDSGNRKHICVLMDEASSEQNQNIISYAIQDVFTEAQISIMPEIEIRRIDTSDTFSAEEAIRDIFIDEQNLPDVIVCLNSIYTQCTYQAAVDYNRVGAVKIIGYYSSEPILEAIEKNIIASSLTVETDVMGQLSVQAFAEYKETGYTNTYVPIRIQVIDQTRATELLKEKGNEDK